MMGLCFTASQWQELEHQALIFKYLMAGLPIPRELVIPIKNSISSSSMGVGYSSLYGKKPDPEPGRCRRTDGKKWRCSKDAYFDSKYCERHMHRGRNRSRKPVETHHTLNPIPSSSSSPIAAFHNLSTANPPPIGTSQMEMDPLSYGIGTKQSRYLQGMRQEGDEHSFFSDTSGNERGLGMESPWRLMPSRVCSISQPKSRNGSIMQTECTQMNTLQDIGNAGMTRVLSKQTQQQQHGFFGSEFGSVEAVKQEGQSLRPFFDEWPKTRDSWSGLEDDRSNQTSFSTTQLSISIPSEFSATSSRSPNDD